MNGAMYYDSIICLKFLPSFFQVLENGEGCTRKSLNENAALLENPESYRLSCITNVYEDVVLEVQGPVGEAAAQIKALAK